ncbi:vimentin-type intermediate filament-associated coiled-coil protein [Fukomys damarensis]|uniref:vimentin-type intermediate filament-associated coiled-coil protein n=1 Tax=Fukomys damarensis TaxID=885580 RepID=UPI0005401DE5|nr:vimentin-type intermediate filament-associated coiled-coil protein [Fukomys damarensis]
MPLLCGVARIRGSDQSQGTKSIPNLPLVQPQVSPSLGRSFKKAHSPALGRGPAGTATNGAAFSWAGAVPKVGPCLFRASVTRHDQQLRTALDELGRAKDGPVRESDFRHDQQLRTALDELGRAKDGEISALQEQLLTSEAAVHSLQAAVRQRDELIGQLWPRAELLQDICHRRPPLAALLTALAEAERLGPLPDSAPGHLLPGGPGPPLANSTVEEEEEQDEGHLQPAVFGTTV